MGYLPSFSINSVVRNSDIVKEFKCGNMGGMRRSRQTNTLVIISDYTKGLYEDKWQGDIYNVHACQDTKLNFLVMNSFREFYAAA